MLISQPKNFALAAVAVALLTLTGCSLGGAQSSDGASSQSRSDACQSLNKALQATTLDLTSASRKMSSDPAAAAQSFTDLTANFTKSITTITNPTVKKAADKAATSLSAMAVQVKKALSDPANADAAAVVAAQKSVQDDFNGIGKACS